MSITFKIYSRTQPGKYLKNILYINVEWGKL